MWKQDKYLRDIARQIDGASLISFDIFDTVLFRTVSAPEKIFLHTGELLHELYPQYGIPPEVFAGMRAEADSLARKRTWEEYRHEDVTLEEIYAEFGFGEQYRLRAAECELQAEARYLYLNRHIEAFMRYCREQGKTLAMVSDTYLSKRKVIGLLEGCGFDASLIDIFIISSEYRLLKYDGKLFQKLVEAVAGISPEQILHIGDSKAKDIDGASLAGIRAEYYGVVPRTGLHPASLEISSFSTVEQTVTLRKLACSLLPHNLSTPEEITLYETGAAVFGPVYAAFAEWIVEQCVGAGIGVVLAFMREGELLARIIDRAARNRGNDLAVKTVFISRRTTEIAALGTIDGAIIDEYIHRDRLTLSDLFMIFYLDIESSPFAADASATVEQYKKSGSFDGLNSYFRRPDTLAEINRRVTEQRELLTEYIQSLTGGMPAATVDVGFRGTMQACLTDIKANGGAELLHLMMMGIPYNNKFLLRGVKLRGWLGYGSENQQTIERIYRRIQMPEAVTNADTGTTLRYEKKTGEITPVLENVNIPEDNKRKKDIMWQGIFRYQQCWFGLLAEKPRLLAEVISDINGACGILSRLLLMPTPEEASVLGSLYYDESILNSEKSTVIKAHEFRFFDMVGDPEAFIASCLSYAFPEHVYWPEGVVAIRKPRYFAEKFIKAHASPAYINVQQFLSSADLTGKRIAVYGAGAVGRELSGILSELNVKIGCIVDNNPALQGRYVSGIKVISPEASIGRADAYIITPLRFEDEIRELLLELTQNQNIKPEIIAYR